MILTKAEPNEGYPHLRFTSENEIWEVGIGELTIFGGIRIVAGKCGTPFYELNYCAGQDTGMAVGILVLVMQIMAKMPESIGYQDFRKAFPRQSIKPMISDPECWKALRKAANSEVLV